MGQPADQRVPENGSLIDCHPDVRIVQIGGVYYAVAFLDTGLAPDFCTKSFANKFQRQYLGQTYKVIHEGMKKGENGSEIDRRSDHLKKRPKKKLDAQTHCSPILIRMGGQCEFGQRWQQQSVVLSHAIL